MQLFISFIDTYPDNVSLPSRLPCTPPRLHRLQSGGHTILSGVAYKVYCSDMTQDLTNKLGRHPRSLTR